MSHFALFKDLFLNIRDDFISSGEYGLDSYLSIRIRHGTLEGQVRSCFETLNLISEKDSATGEYTDNPLWDNMLTMVEGNTRQAIKELLRHFSRQIDEIILRLRQRLFQIQTETKHPDGLFDYRFSDDALFQLFHERFSDIKEYHAFMDDIFAALWNRTEINLANIRSHISASIQPEAYNLVRDLDANIRQKVDTTTAPDLLHNLTACMTDVQKEFYKIAEWFSISGHQLLPTFKMDSIIEVCISSINNLYPNRQIKPETSIECDRTFDGRHFAHLSDIFRTLLGNVIVHSGLPPEKLEIWINVSIANERLRLMFSNTISQEVKEADPVNILTKAYASLQMNAVNEAITKEGGTGYVKINKILRFDLRRQAPSFDFRYDNNCFTVEISFELEGLTQ